MLKEQSNMNLLSRGGAKPAMAAALTYSLGRSLYVPLACRCNSRTLPETRGPNFLLPSNVVSSLLHVRDLECSTQQYYKDIFDENAERQRLPPLLSDMRDPVTCAHNEKEHGSQHRPTATEFVDEIHQRLQQESFDSLVIAGEGEPTLRLGVLLEIAKWASSKQQLPVRVTTNGLAEVDCISQMKHAGVDMVSVALMTANPQEYSQLMQPYIMSDTHENTAAHEVVCEFVRQSVKAGLNVEVTGVNHDCVDKAATERLAKSLGVSSPIRWRPYFE